MCMCSLVIQKACAILLCMHDISASSEVGEACVCVCVCVCMYVGKRHVHKTGQNMLVAICKCARYMYYTRTLKAGDTETFFDGNQPILQDVNF